MRGGTTTCLWRSGVGVTPGPTFGPLTERGRLEGKDTANVRLGNNVWSGQAGRFIGWGMGWVGWSTWSWGGREPPHPEADVWAIWTQHYRLRSSTDLIVGSQTFRLPIIRPTLVTKTGLHHVSEQKFNFMEWKSYGKRKHELNIGETFQRMKIWLWIVHLTTVVNGLLLSSLLMLNACDISFFWHNELMLFCCYSLQAIVI